jgi:hypothetical protein
LIKEQIDKLIKLQEIDLKIIDLKSEKRQLPKIMEELQQEASLINSQIHNVEEELKRLKIEHKEKELELQGKENEIKKYNVQLYQVKTNKEYTALQAEIESLKADCSNLEDEIIALLDKMDDINKEIEEEKEKQKIKFSKFKEEEARINNKISQIDKDIETLKEKREKILVDIDKDIYRKYEKVLRGKDGAALVPVVDHSCGGCHMELPAQVINELSISEKLIFCESCARILYLPH